MLDLGGKMTKEELANVLDGLEYPGDVPKELAQQAKESGLVVVYGGSDDLIEFGGAFREELDSYGGGTYLVDREGPLPIREQIDDDAELERFFSRRKTAKTIKALWDRDGYSWIYETEIPHSTFGIFDDGEKYCRAIVFSINDL